MKSFLKCTPIASDSHQANFQILKHHRRCPPYPVAFEPEPRCLDEHRPSLDLADQRAQTQKVLKRQEKDLGYLVGVRTHHRQVAPEPQKRDDPMAAGIDIHRRERTDQLNPFVGASELLGVLAASSLLMRLSCLTTAPRKRNLACMLSHRRGPERQRDRPLALKLVRRARKQGHQDRCRMGARRGRSTMASVGDLRSEGIPPPRPSRRAVEGHPSPSQTIGVPQDCQHRLERSGLHLGNALLKALEKLHSEVQRLGLSFHRPCFRSATPIQRSDRRWPAAPATTPKRSPMSCA